ncbi:hypothetical protein TNCV_3118001 [Trichonephila clavipes]|uniref:Uncharacterized protein n=1 Tax=Trichonephila clavipes TaxID=2585209 RepID=A0A8X6W932_TRICX|nr:hypothetical protein TNCV_3118001 [Trichonephila clavipes]
MRSDRYSEADCVCLGPPETSLPSSSRETFYSFVNIKIQAELGTIHFTFCPDHFNRVHLNWTDRGMQTRGTRIVWACIVFGTE